MSVFERDFDLEIENEKKNFLYEVNNPKKYSEVDIERILKEYRENIYQEIFDEGFQKGYEECKNSIESRSKEIVNLCLPVISSFNDSMEEYKDIIINDSEDLIYSIFQKILPDIYQYTYDDLLKEEIEKIVNYSAGSSKIIVETSKNENLSIKTIFEELVDYEISSEFVVNDNLNDGDFSVKWDDGRVKVDLNKFKNEFFNALNIKIEKDENNE